MGIVTGEREPLVVGRYREGLQCANSHRLATSGAGGTDEEGKLSTGDGEDEGPEMSIFSEQVPRDILHFETVYEGNKTLSDHGHSIQHEQLYKEGGSSKALQRQKELIESQGSANLRHLNNVHQQWTFSSRDKDAFLHVTEFTENSILESVVDSNGNGSPEGSSEQNEESKQVFVRRGDSAAWRMWQEILGQSQPKKQLFARYESDKPIVMCFPSSVSVYLSIEGKALNHKTKVFVEVRDQAGDLLLSGPFTTHENRIDLDFTSSVKGLTIVSLRCMGPKGAEVVPYELKVEVGGNNPLMSFSDDSSWPVAVAYDTKKRLVYVAFSNYINQYYEEGDSVEYSKRLAKLDDGHYNDLTLSEDGRIIVASFSGWRTESLKYRYQAIHMYGTEAGNIVHVIHNDFPIFIFDSPILHIATKNKKTILVADTASICECSLETGMITARLSAEGMGSVSRIAFSRDRYFIADANSGYVKIYDELGCLEKSLQVKTSSGDQVVGMTGLAVDEFGNIIVCDCLSGTINAYRDDGTLFCSIDSDWDVVQWPLHLTSTPDGHVFVVDHRHGCIKKFRYL